MGTSTGRGRLLALWIGLVLSSISSHLGLPLSPPPPLANDMIAQLIVASLLALVLFTPGVRSAKAAAAKRHL